MSVIKRRVGASAAVAVVIAAGGLGISSIASAKNHKSAKKVNWSTVTSAKAGGGMAALIKAAKAEGNLNVIALPADWANYLPFRTSGVQYPPPLARA